MLIGTMCLTTMEPRSLSSANLKQIKCRGKHTSTTKGLCQLVEFATGLAPDTELTGAYRYWPYLQALLVALNKQRGRRCADLFLPPDWEAEGLYALVFEAGVVYVMHRFTKQRVAVLAQKIPPMDCTDALYIVCNWSEVRATLKSSSDVGHPGCCLSELFPNQLIDNTIRLPSPPRDALRCVPVKQAALIDRRKSSGSLDEKLAIVDGLESQDSKFKTPTRKPRGEASDQRSAEESLASCEDEAPSDLPDKNVPRGGQDELKATTDVEEPMSSNELFDDLDVVPPPPSSETGADSRALSSSAQYSCPWPGAAEVSVVGSTCV